jgi:hypothetical protein
VSVAEPRDLLHCSFCSKSQQQVRKLIAGPGVYVCDECVALCNEIIDEELAGDPLDPLQQLRTLSSRSDALVARLKAEGVPWEDIAAALRRDDTT